MHILVHLFLSHFYVTLPVIVVNIDLLNVFGHFEAETLGLCELQLSLECLLVGG